MALSTSLFLILLPVSLLGLRTDQVAAHLVILQVVVHALHASVQLELVCKAPQPRHTQFATEAECAVGYFKEEQKALPPPNFTLR